ncbi:MAG TPA: type IVB secretion system protein IcmH/DotU [Ignavibacteriaceae bacterium]|nr:type IVB secretion system protein IcmH/DotU [Ignavibacteriaceae bacterium]
MKNLSHLADKRKNLADIASESFILILQLRSTNDYGNAAALKAKVLEMLERLERNARSCGIDNEKIRLTKFALAAFIDETIIGSEWDQKDSWLSEPLQILLFDTFNAGEEFFSTLNLLRQRSGANKEILEIYFLCLTLGFKGKYQLQSPEYLRRIIDDLNTELHPEASITIDSLSPNAKPHENFIKAVNEGLPLWIYPAAAVLLCIIFYIIMSSSVSGKADDVVEGLIRLLG